MGRTSQRKGRIEREIVCASLGRRLIARQLGEIRRDPARSVQRSFVLLLCLKDFKAEEKERYDRVIAHASCVHCDLIAGEEVITVITGWRLAGIAVARAVAVLVATTVAILRAPAIGRSVVAARHGTMLEIIPIGLRRRRARRGGQQQGCTKAFHR